MADLCRNLVCAQFGSGVDREAEDAQVTGYLKYWAPIERLAMDRVLAARRKAKKAAHLAANAPAVDGATSSAKPPHSGDFKRPAPPGTSCAGQLRRCGRSACESCRAGYGGKRSRKRREAASDTAVAGQGVDAQVAMVDQLNNLLTHFAARVKQQQEAARTGGSSSSSSSTTGKGGEAAPTPTPAPAPEGGVAPDKDNIRVQAAQWMDPGQYAFPVYTQLQECVQMALDAATAAAAEGALHAGGGALQPPLLHAKRQAVQELLTALLQFAQTRWAEGEVGGSALGGGGPCPCRAMGTLCTDCIVAQAQADKSLGEEALTRM